MSTLPAPANNEPSVAPHLTSTRAESAGRRYFAAALAVCCVAYLFPFFVLHSGFKADWTTSYWGGVVNTTYRDQHQDADIVIFGDSTAATNVDPVRMSRDLHRKVLVLPNVSTSLPVTGYDPLDGYLRDNKAPQLIVFYLSAWDLDFLHNPFTPIVEEGVEMLLRHESWTKIFHYAVGHPEKILMFPLHFYASTNRVGDLLYFRHHEVAPLQQGHILRLSHNTPMKQDCVFETKLFKAGLKDASAQEGLSRFAKPGTQTMVFVSPVPRCKDLDIIQSAQHPEVESTPLQVLEPERFLDDGWQAHMLPGEIGPSTDYLEQAIRQKLQQPAPTAQPR